MFSIASFDDFVRPDEKHPRDDIGVFFEAGLIGEILMDLKLFLVRILIHQPYQSEN